MEKLHRKLTLARVEDMLAIFAGIAIIVLMMLTVVDVSGRYLFLQPLQVNYELSELLLVVIIALAISATQREGGHLGMDTVVGKFKKMRRPVYPAFQVSGLFLAELVFVFALYSCIRLFLKAYHISEITTGPVYIITWPFKGVLCLGLFFMCVRLLMQLIQAVKSIRVWGGRNNGMD